MRIRQIVADLTKYSLTKCTIYDTNINIIGKQSCFRKQEERKKPASLRPTRLSGFSFLREEVV